MSRLIKIFKVIGNFQLQVLLGLLFFGLLTPYALLLRGLFRARLLPPGEWQEVEAPTLTLEQMRRSF